MLTTAAQLIARYDEQTLAQLSSSDGQAVNTARVEMLLGDAWSMVSGYLIGVPANLVPEGSTLEAHQAILTLELLAGSRPGQEFESIRSAAKGVREFLRSLLRPGVPTATIEELQGSDLPPAFDDESLTEFTSFERGAE
jgi:phage gp36-like protein